MIENLRQDAKKILPIDDDVIVLRDMLGVDKSAPWEKVNRNIYRVASNGNVVWQIETRAAQTERFPFTNVYFDNDGKLRAYCWDGGEYGVDTSSGKIDMGKLAK